MPAAVEFLDATWPLLILRFPADVSRPVMQSLIDGVEGAYRHEQPFVMLCDLTAVAKFPGHAERKMLSDWLHGPERIANEKRYVVATAVVMTSGPLRALLSAIQFVSPPSYPQVWKATEPEAFEWCYERIVQARLPLTEALEAARADQVRRNRASVKAG